MRLVAELDAIERDASSAKPATKPISARGGTPKFRAVQNVSIQQACTGVQRGDDPTGLAPTRRTTDDAAAARSMRTRLHENHDGVLNPFGVAVDGEFLRANG
jgi:hypothetical protein